MSVLHAQIDFLPESNNTLPFKTIFPRSGVSIPAMHFNVMLLPQPDAPRIPVIPCFPSVSKETDNTLSFSFFRSPPVNSSFLLSTQIHSCHDEQGKSNNDQHVFSCGIHIPGRHLRINGEWQCPCFPAIFPAIIAVAPNSPSPLVNASTPPERIPGLACGKIIFQKWCVHSCQASCPHRSDLHRPARSRLSPSDTSVETRSRQPPERLPAS